MYKTGCWLIALLLLFIRPIYAGTLDDFEREARKQPREYKTRRQEQSCDGVIDCIITEPFFDTLFDQTLIAISDDMRELAMNRQTLHNVYMSYDHQDVSDRVLANHYVFNLELQRIGFNCKFSEFSESTPDDRLTLNRCHGLFVLLRGRELGISLGIGGYRLQGDHETNGVTGSLPITYNYDSRLSFKFTYEQYETIESLSAEFFYGRKLRLVGGYKELAAGNMDLSGPFIGLAYKW